MKRNNRARPNPGMNSSNSIPTKLHSATICIRGVKIILVHWKGRNRLLTSSAFFLAFAFEIGFEKCAAGDSFIDQMKTVGVPRWNISKQKIEGAWRAKAVSTESTVCGLQINSPRIGKLSFWRHRLLEDFNGSFLFLTREA